MDDVILYRCNACGHNHEAPAYCPHCNTPICPSCNRAGCITNVTAMKQLVSNKVPTGKPTRKPANKQKGPTKKRVSSVDALMRRVEEAEARRKVI